MCPKNSCFGRLRAHSFDGVLSIFFGSFAGLFMCYYFSTCVLFVSWFLKTKSACFGYL